jgi:ribosomal protein S18 acetylase RimI-like enzyme
VGADIRVGTPDDVGAVAALHALSRKVTYRGILPDDALDAINVGAFWQHWADRIARERTTHQLLVAEEDGKLRGFSYVGPGDEEERVPPDTGVLYAIHVHPYAQGQGLGRSLMDRCLRTFAEMGFARAVLWVLEGNDRARRFYERGGWRSDGTVRDAPFGEAITRQLRYGRSI